MPRRNLAVYRTLILLLAPCAPEAQPQQITVGGTVQAAFHVEVLRASASDACIRWTRLSPAVIRLWIETTAACPQTIELDVALRTNAAQYEFVAAPSSEEGSLGIQFGLPRPTGASVDALAASNFRSPADSPCAASRCAATGTRISVRGTFSSPANALLVPMTLTPGNRVAPFTLDLTLQGK